MSESEPWRWFEAGRVTLFVLAGVSLVVFTGVTVAQALTHLTVGYLLRAGPSADVHA